MEIEGYARLTERQKECLRLVLLGHRSKEIAQLLGISSHTVDDHLKAAIRLLGVGSRAEAARLVATKEHGPQQLGTQAAGIVYPQGNGLPGAAPDGGVNQADQHEPLAIQEARSAFAAAGPIEKLRNFWPFPTKGHPRNDLTIAQKAGWILILVAFLALSAGTLIGAMANTTQVLRAIFSS